VATLSYTDDQAEIILWDVSALTTHQKKRRSLSLPIATAAPHPSTSSHIATCFVGLLQAQGSPDLRISVSWDGSQVAVFSTGSSARGECERFHLFNFDHKASAVNETSNPLLSQQQREQKPFTGYAKFLNTEKDERFFACDGQYVSVYSTTGTWKKIYSIELVVPPRLQSVQLDPELPLLANLHAAKVGEELHPADKEELERLIDERSQLARFAVESAQGEYFLWHKGWNVSVWHLNLGSMISYIYLGLGFMEKDHLSLEDMKAATPGKVEFLYSDHDTIALRVVVTKRINVDMAILFSAETGREQTFASLCGLEARTPATILDQFDLHSDGCTLRMPALPGSDAGNIMHSLTLKPDGRYGIYQQSSDLPTSDNPTFITLWQGSSLDIHRLEGPTSVPDVAGSCDCSPKCLPTKKLLGNSGSKQIASVPGRPPFVIETN
jgi:hypothetical protein